MDLLLGYGSGGDSEDEQQEQQAAVVARKEEKSSEPQASALFTKLPNPSTSSLNKPLLFAGLPKPATKKKFTSGGGFRVPIDFGEAPTEEYVPNKRLKTNNTTVDDSLEDLLPAPKTGPSSKQLELDSLFARQPSEQPATIDAAPEPAPVVMAPNEMYRVDRAPQTAPHAYDYSNYQQQQQQPGAYYPTAADPAEAYLETALAAERAKAARRGDASALEGMQFKEIKADDVRYMDPGQRAEVNAVRSALGPDYEAKLRAEAAKVGTISKGAKAKHQLASLYVAAKHQELEQFEKRATGTKTKAESARKYGW